MNRKNILLVILSVITAVYYFPIINFPVGPIDESFILVGAERILKGQIPHKDFSSEYPEGQYYVLAALFKMFGTSVVTERVYDILIKLLLSLIIFLIIRFVSSDVYAFMGWLMSLIWVQYIGAPGYSVFPSLLFIYVGVYFFLLHIQDQKRFYVVLCSIFIVLSTLFRHDLGGFAAIMIIMLLIVRKLIGVQSWMPVVLFTASGVMAGLPVILYLLIYSNITSAVNDLIFVPMAYLKHQTLPYPSLSRWNLPFYVFPLVIVICAISSIILIKCKMNDIRAYALLLISSIGILFFDRIRMRPDLPHLLPIALTGILLTPILLDTLLIELSLSSLQKRVVYSFVVVVLGITLSNPTVVMSRMLSRLNGAYTVNKVNPDIERAKYSAVPQDIKDVVSYIKMNTSKDDYIYVGVKNHDQFVFNDLLIYFLADRNYASRYHALNPGVQTTLKIQNEMINEFRKNRPRLLVLGSRTWNEHNLSSIDTKVDALDNYIASTFELKKSYGPYEIWLNNNL